MTINPAAINPKDRSGTEVRRAFSLLSRMIQSIQAEASLNSFEDMVFYSTVSPATNGVQTNFTTPLNYREATLQVYRNHEILIRGIDFTETGTNTFNLNTPPDADEVIRVSYIKS